VEGGHIIREYADGRKEVLGDAIPDMVYNGSRVIEIPDA
jgi:hypothetical protein